MNKIYLVYSSHEKIFIGLCSGIEEGFRKIHAYIHDRNELAERLMENPAPQNTVPSWADVRAINVRVNNKVVEPHRHVDPIFVNVHKVGVEIVCNLSYHYLWQRCGITTDPNEYSRNNYSRIDFVGEEVGFVIY